MNTEIVRSHYIISALCKEFNSKCPIECFIFLFFGQFIELFSLNLTKNKENEKDAKKQIMDSAIKTCEQIKTSLGNSWELYQREQKND